MSHDILRKKIGELEIFPEQTSAAHNILEVFQAGLCYPLLVAQPQQGKCGTCIAAISGFIDSCKSQNQTYEVVYLINLADNSLKAQTEQRIFQSGLLSDIRLLHQAEVSKFTPGSVDLRLIVVDEAHIALGKDKPVDAFFKRCGVNYGLPISNWSNQSNYVLSVSATPYATIIRHELDKTNGAKTFEPVRLKLAPNYFTMQQMKLQGRFKKAEKTYLKTKVTDFFKGAFAEFKFRCDHLGNGHLIVRTSGKGPNVIANWILNNTLPGEVDIQVFSSKNQNIDQLDEILSIKPAKPSVAIILGSLRAGKTLTTTEHIRSWIETDKANADTVAQVVGRCLGYPVEVIGLPKRPKTEDTFPVYCNLEEIDHAIKFYEDMRCVPNGVQNKSSNRETQLHEIIVQDSIEPNELKSTCSKVNENDIALDILNMAQRGGDRWYYLDGPNKDHPTNTNPVGERHLDHWYLLEKEHPEYIGKYVKVVIVGSKVEQEYKNTIKKNCLLA